MCAEQTDHLLKGYFVCFTFRIEHLSESRYEQPTITTRPLPSYATTKTPNSVPMQQEQV